MAPLDWPTEIDTRIDALRRHAADLSPPVVSAAPDLRDEIAALLDGAPEDARISIHVEDLDTGAVLADHGGGRQLNPASNQKLVTAITAIELLGPDYQFETRVLRGPDALYLVGEGDPSLGMSELYALAADVLARTSLAGIEKIVVDNSAFSSRRFGPGYSAHGSGPAYMAPSGALSLNFNTVEIEVHPTGHGRRARVGVTPASPHLELFNDARTGGGGALQVSTGSLEGRTRIRVKGSIPGGHAPITFVRRVQDPAAFAGGAFATVLAQLASATPLPVEEGVAPARATPIATHASAPLVNVLASTMKYSNNFVSEQVLRTLAWRASGEAGTWASGIAVIARFWEAIRGTHSAAAMHAVNGSGLSRRGRISARTLVRFLALTQREGSPARALEAAMATAGGVGTLRNRVRFAGARLRAKTGTLNGVSALSGIASPDGHRPGHANHRAHTGHRVAFSILVNGAEAQPSRALQDRVVIAILRYRGQPGRG